MSCGFQCFEIGGPWIAENPDCPIHGSDGVGGDVQNLLDEVSSLKKENIAMKNKMTEMAEKQAAMQSEISDLRRRLFRVEGEIGRCR